MLKRTLGQTNESVLPIGLGAMPLSTATRPAEGDAIAVILAAIDAGVDFIDTANVYGKDDSEIGHNERLIAAALKFRRNERIKVATKGGFTRPQGAWVTDGHPKSLRLACEKSLKALEVEEIFLYQLHAPDSKITFEDSIGELSRLKEEGKVIHLGISNVNASEIERAQSIVRIETVQNRFNPLCQRDLANGVVEATRRHKMTYIAFSPTGGGQLHKELSQHKTLLDIAGQYKISSYQVMLAWCLQKDKGLIAIPGASKISSIQSSVASLQTRLDDEEMQRIDALSKELT